VLHKKQLIVGYRIGQNKCLFALPMYWLVLNLRSCFICVSDICGLVQNEFDDILSIFVSLVHLWILGKFWASSVRYVEVVCFVGIFVSYE
jgi:hypothetical protein